MYWIGYIIQKAIKLVLSIWIIFERCGFSKTQVVVLDLVSQEGICLENYYIIRLDNLFTSTSLPNELKKKGFGGAGTIRILKTAREEDEERSRTTKQRQ